MTAEKRLAKGGLATPVATEEALRNYAVTFRTAKVIGGGRRRCKVGNRRVFGGMLTRGEGRGLPASSGDLTQRRERRARTILFGIGGAVLGAAGLTGAVALIESASATAAPICTITFSNTAGGS